jgi:hypothetical protein
MSLCGRFAVLSIYIRFVKGITLCSCVARVWRNCFSERTNPMCWFVWFSHHALSPSDWTMLWKSWNSIIGRAEQIYISHQYGGIQLMPKLKLSIGYVLTVAGSLAVWHAAPPAPASNWAMDIVLSAATVEALSLSINCVLAVAADDIRSERGLTWAPFVNCLNT